MSGPPKENAPRSWQSGGALSNRSDDIRRPRPERRFPLHEATFFMLAALVWSDGITRFRELGIRPEDIEDDNARLIAGAFIGGRSTCDPEVIAVLGKTAPDTRSLGEAVLFAINVLERDPSGYVWAVRSVERFAFYHAEYWLAANFEHLARQIREYGMSPVQAMYEVDRILEVARPCVLRAEGRAS